MFDFTLTIAGLCILQDIVVVLIGLLFVGLFDAFYSILNIFNFTNSVKKID